MGGQRNLIPAVFVAVVLAGETRAEAVRGRSGKVVGLLEAIRVKYDLLALAGAVVLEEQPAAWTLIKEFLLKKQGQEQK